MIVYTVYLSLFLKTWLGMLLETKIYDPMIFNYVPVRILTLVSCSQLNCSPTSMPYMTHLALWLPYLFTNVWLKKKYTDHVPKISSVVSVLATASFVATSIAVGLLTVSIASLSSIGTFSTPFSSFSNPASNLFVWYLTHLNSYLINWSFSYTMIIFYTLRDTTVNKLTLMLRLDFIKGVENNLTPVWGWKKFL